jgi:hypothetical protein
MLCHCGNNSNNSAPAPVFTSTIVKGIEQDPQYCLSSDNLTAYVVRCRLTGLPDCIISAVWAVFFLAVGASMASYGTCAAGGGMTGGGSMSRSMALMFGGSLAGSSLTGSTTTTSISNADIANAQAAMNNMLNQFSQLNNVPMRRLRYTESSTAILGRKGAPAAADASHVMRRQLLGSVMSVIMQPQVLCG